MFGTVGRNGLYEFSVLHLTPDAEIRSAADLQVRGFHLIYCINLDMQWVEVAEKLTVMCFAIKMVSEK